MYDHRGYLVILSAVFLALAIGLLIGVSYGEDILIYNQQEVIELLESKLLSRDEKISIMKEELHAWETFREYFWHHIYSGVFPDEDEYSVDIISRSIALNREISSLLERQGINCRVITLKSGFEEYHHNLSSGTAGGVEPGAQKTNPEVNFLLSLLSDEEIAAGGESAEVLNELQAKGKLEMQGDWSRRPTGNTVLLLDDAGKKENARENVSESDTLEKENIKDDTPTPVIKELAGRLEKEDRSVIIVFAGYETYLTGAGIQQANENYEQLPDSHTEWGETIVDHADTFWGQLALLEIIRTGARGHYGFQPGSLGILP